MMLRSLSPLLLVAGATIFCRYTVRDVAFIDFGDEGYSLHAMLPAAEDPSLAAELRRAGASLLLDTNVELDIVEVAATPSAEVEGFLDTHHVKALPALVLVAPDGRSVVRDLPPGPAASAGRTQILGAVVSSPTRRALIDGVIDHYGVVLLVEGSDATANRAAQAIVDKAIDEVKSVFDRMPKDVGDPPLQVTVPYAERQYEQVLLWSIGLDVADTAAPAVAVFMGRARRVGPVLVGGEITDAGLFGILAVIGQSCECDLDRSWMQGPRPPMRWDLPTRESATRRLGFDPESPLVRSEILGILARGPGGRAPADTEGRSLEELLLGYEELVVEDVASPNATEEPPTPAESTKPSATPPPPSQNADPPFHPLDTRRSLSITTLLLILALAALVVVGFGIGILVTKRER